MNIVECNMIIGDLSYRIPFDIFCNTARETLIILEDNPSNM